jgi:transcriptional antiterminator NusG
LTNEGIDRLVEVKSMAQQISIGDIVEFTTGPFKGYKAKVLRTDEIKGDVTVELMDVVVPIPITAKMNTARVIQKAEKAEG